MRRGYGWVGHELGDGKYILDQKPDLILFASFEKTDSLFPADQQIVEDPRFKQYYQPVNFDTPEPNSVRAYTFVRRIDGKLGMESTGRSLMVPAFLAKIDAANSVHLVNGKATLTVPAEHDATFEQLPVGPWYLGDQARQQSARRAFAFVGGGCGARSRMCSMPRNEGSRKRELHARKPVCSAGGPAKPHPRAALALDEALPK